MSSCMEFALDLHLNKKNKLFLWRETLEMNNLQGRTVFLCLLGLVSLGWSGSRSVIYVGSLGPWCIKGTNKSFSTVDSSVPSMHHDLSNPGSLILIQIIPKKWILSVYTWLILFVVIIVISLHLPSDSQVFPKSSYAYLDLPCTAFSSSFIQGTLRVAKLWSIGQKLELHKQVFSFVNTAFTLSVTWASKVS